MNTTEGGGARRRVRDRHIYLVARGDDKLQERAALRDVARFIRGRVAELPPDSAIARELAYVAIRLDLVARARRPGEAVRQGSG